MPIAIPTGGASAILHNLVDQIMSLRKQVAVAKSPPDKEALDRQIHAANREVDRLVYALYGLTDEEIGIVQENGEHP